MKKAIGYIRVSTTQQDLLRQEILIKEWCSLNNYTLVKVLEDKLSGTIAERKGYLELLQTTKEDTDIIVVSELSRLSRQDDIMETLTTINNILKANIDVCFLDNNAIYKGGKSLDLMSILRIAIEAQNAATERKKIVERMVSGRRAKFMTFENMCIGGGTPFGYIRKPNPDYIRNQTPKTLLERNENAEIVQEIFNDIIRGKKLKEVAEGLRARGIKTNVGKDFDTSSVWTIIHNRLYMGEWKFSGKTVKGDAIVTEDVWHKAQECLKTNRMFDIIKGMNFNPLKGILKCPCGKGMYIVHMRNYYQYRCGVKKNAYDVQVCNNAGIEKDTIVSCCWWCVKSQINTEEYLRQTNEEVAKMDMSLRDIDILIKGKEQQIKAIEDQKTQLANNMAQIDNNELLLRFQAKFDELVTKGNILAKDIDQYKKDKLNTIAQKEDLLNREDILDNVSIEEKARIFQKYLSKVVFYGEPKKHRGFIVVTFKNGFEMVFLSIAKKHNVCACLNTFGFDVETRKVFIDVLPKDKENPFDMNTERRYYDCWEVERVFPDLIEENNIFAEVPEFV